MHYLRYSLRAGDVCWELRHYISYNNAVPQLPIGKLNFLTNPDYLIYILVSVMQRYGLWKNESEQDEDMKRIRQASLSAEAGQTMVQSLTSAEAAKTDDQSLQGPSGEAESTDGKKSKL